MIKSLRRAMRRTVVSVARKAVALPWFPEWMKHSFPTYTFKRLVEEGYAKNSAVFACVRVHANALPEPECHVWQIDGKDRVIVPDHPLRQLFVEPNPHMDEVEFWERFWTYAAIGGSAYIWIERSRAGEVLHLWPMSRAQIAPIPSASGWLAGYQYTYVQGDIERALYVPPEDILPYFWAVDPLKPLEGLSPLEAAARAVDTDNEILRYVYALLKNDAVPQTLVALKDTVSADDLKDLRERFEEKYGGDNRGSAAIIEGSEATITRIGANLDELAAETLHNIPETRIAGAFEVPAVLAGLNVGLQRAINANARELREFYTEQTLAPRWRKLGSMLTTRLLRREFEAGPELVCAFDVSSVRALQEDRLAKMDAITRAVGPGWMLRSEGRAMMGHDSVPEDDVYLIPTGVVVTNAGELPAQPAPDVGNDAGDIAEAKAMTGAEIIRKAAEDKRELIDVFEQEVAKALEEQQVAVLNSVNGNGNGRA